MDASGLLCVLCRYGCTNYGREENNASLNKTSTWIHDVG